MIFVIRNYARNCQIVEVLFTYITIAQIIKVVGDRVNLSYNKKIIR